MKEFIRNCQKLSWNILSLKFKAAQKHFPFVINVTFRSSEKVIFQFSILSTLRSVNCSTLWICNSCTVFNNQEAGPPKLSMRPLVQKIIMKCRVCTKVFPKSLSLAFLFKMFDWLLAISFPHEETLNRFCREKAFLIEYITEKLMR